MKNSNQVRKYLQIICSFKEDVDMSTGSSLKASESLKGDEGFWEEFERKRETLLFWKGKLCGEVSKLIILFIRKLWELIWAI